MRDMLPRRNDAAALVCADVRVEPDGSRRRPLPCRSRRARKARSRTRCISSAPRSPVATASHPRHTALQALRAPDIEADTGRLDARRSTLGTGGTRGRHTAWPSATPASSSRSRPGDGNPLCAGNLCPQRAGWAECRGTAAGTVTGDGYQRDQVSE